MGAGFVSDHLAYEKIADKIKFNIKLIDVLLEVHKPDVLINCIGKTGRPNVDWCESNKEETALGNVAMPILLAEVCAKKSIHLIQIGSGCIFYGESPNFHHVQADGLPMPDTTSGSFTVTLPAKKIDDGWKEDDFANPKSYYSKTKYACDLALNNMKNVTTLRIRMPISSKNTPRNFINKIKEYKQLIDIPNSVTFMDDLVKCIDWVAKGGYTGLFHVTNPEPISATQVMREYQKYVPEHIFEIIDEIQLDKLTIAKRSNCILNTNKLNEAGFHMTPSMEALKDCMAKYITNI